MSAWMQAPCATAGNCLTCVTAGIKDTMSSDCKDGATDAVKSALEGVDFLGGISAQLDTVSLQDLGGDTVEEACTTCLTAISDWLKESSPSECTGSEFCYFLDYAAGEILDGSISGACSASDADPDDADDADSSDEDTGSNGDSNDDGAATASPTPSPEPTPVPPSTPAPPPTPAPPSTPSPNTTNERNDEMSTAREGKVPACSLGLIMVICALVRW